MVKISRESDIADTIKKYKTEYGSSVKATVGKRGIHFDWKTPIDEVTQYEYVLIGT